MMRHLLRYAVAFALLLALSACSKDNPTGGAEDELIGVWIWQSASRSGTPIAVPADTLIYKDDFTGHYGAVASLDSYNFDYWVSHDTVFSFHKSGSSVGVTDSIRYKINLDRLTRYVRIHPDTVETQLWDRL